MLITRPNHDLTTTYLYYWSTKIIEQAEKSNEKVIDLKEKRVTEKEFTGIILKTKPSFIVINGHGNESTVTGYNNKILVQVGKNENLFKNAVVYARSCSCAKKLGPASIKKGTKAFIGYTDEFVFLIDENFITQPLNDKTASLFLEASSYVAVSLLKGHTAIEANNRSKEIFKNTINKYMVSGTSKENSELLPYLLWDMNHQECLGNKKATIKYE